MAGERKYTIWQAPLLAFFLPGFYKDVGESWRGVGILPLFLFCAVSMVVHTAVIARQILNFVNNPHIAAYVSQLPKMTVTDGKLSIDKSVPYYITDPQGGEKIAVFRTQEEELKSTESDPPIIVTKVALYMKGVNSESYERKMDFSQFPSEHGATKFDANSLKTILNGVAFGAPVVIFLFGVPISLIGHYLLGVVYGAICMLVANVIMQRGLSFETVLRVAVLALTPSIVISTILTGTAVFMTYPNGAMIWAMVSIPISLGYAIFGVLQVRSPSAPAGGAAA